jgi:hypothetical protein
MNHHYIRKSHYNAVDGAFDDAINFQARFLFTRTINAGAIK